MWLMKPARIWNGLNLRDADVLQNHIIFIIAAINYPGPLQSLQWTVLLGKMCHYVAHPRMHSWGSALAWNYAGKEQSASAPSSALSDYLSLPFAPAASPFCGFLDLQDCSAPPCLSHSATGVFPQGEVFLLTPLPGPRQVFAPFQGNTLGTPSMLPSPILVSAVGVQERSAHPARCHGDH